MSLRRALVQAVAGILLGCAFVWAVSTAAIYVAMRQTPERFGAFMSHVPGIAMAALPFRPLWMSARRGSLQVGDTAPNFALRALKSDRTVTLSAEYRQKPVVLVFGSYT